MKDFLKTSSAIIAVGMLTFSGCAEPSGSGDFSEVTAHDNEQPNADPHAGHAHPTHGPHGGDLIELGNEEYHAELVHPHGHDDDVHHSAGAGGPHDDDEGSEHHRDEADRDPEGHHADDRDDRDGHEHAGITIYILDGAAKDAVAISAAEITLNLSHDGKPAQFTLSALPDSDDPDGKSSRFASTEKGLLELFHESEHVEGALVLSIGGSSYRGQLVHAHDDDHGHAHGEHKGEGEHPHH